MLTRRIVRIQRLAAIARSSLVRLSPLLFSLAGAIAAHGQNEIFVTNTNDAGPGSLRQAIADASPTGGTVIGFTGVTGRIGLTSHRLMIDRPLTIQGPGAEVLSVSGNGNVQVFTITNGVTNVVISGLGIVDGGGFNRIPDGVGGGGVGIFPGADVKLIDCVLSSNKTVFIASSWRYVGGAIDNAGRLEVLRCVIVGNSSANGRDDSSSPSSTGGHGGAIFNSGQLSIKSSIISHNRCGRGGIGGGGYCGSYAQPGVGGSGGGLHNVGTASVVSSVFEGNRAGNGGEACASDAFIAGVHGAKGGNGGAIFSSGELVVSNVLLVANQAGSGGNGGRGGISYDTIPSTPGGNGGNGGEGGGVFSQGSARLVDTTIIGNRAVTGGLGGPGGPHDLPPAPAGPTGSNGSPGVGGGVAGSAIMANCTIAANSAAGSGPDMVGTYSSQGGNVVEATDGSTGFGVGDFFGTDPDGDRLPNLVEYAFGTNPRIPTAGAWPVGSIQRIEGTNYLGLSFQRSTNAIGVQCSILVADALVTNAWALGSRYLFETETHERTVEISRQVTGPVETIRLRDRRPASSSPQGFMRVDVSIP